LHARLIATSPGVTALSNSPSLRDQFGLFDFGFAAGVAGTGGVAAGGGGGGADDIAGASGVIGTWNAFG
jgi:hypothetical protein